MLFRLLADVLAVCHLAFILFAVLGAALAFRWPKIILLHVPAAIWAGIVEISGWACPLTPLENRLRIMGGESGYAGGFVEHYLLPVLYPAALTRNIQILMGVLVLALNVLIYIQFVRSLRRKDK